MCVGVWVNHRSTLGMMYLCPLQEGEAGIMQHPEFMRQGQLMVQDKKGAGTDMGPAVLAWGLLFWHGACCSGMGPAVLAWGLLFWHGACCTGIDWF